MAIIYKLPQTEIDEITNHIDVTAGILVKCYTSRQLSALDGIDERTVRTCGRYLPVRIDDKGTRRNYLNKGRHKPYKKAWIRVDEIKAVFNRMNKKTKLVEEYK